MKNDRNQTGVCDYTAKHWETRTAQSGKLLEVEGQTTNNWPFHHTVMIQSYEFCGDG